MCAHTLSGALPPPLFDSPSLHSWWGEPVALFLRCLEQHAADHKLGDDAAYWVCA